MIFTAVSMSSVASKNSSMEKFSKTPFLCGDGFHYSRLRKFLMHKLHK